MKNVSFQSPEILSNRTNHVVPWKWKSYINGLKLVYKTIYKNVILYSYDLSCCAYVQWVPLRQGRLKLLLLSVLARQSCIFVQCATNGFQGKTIWLITNDCTLEEAHIHVLNVKNSLQVRTAWGPWAAPPVRQARQLPYHFWERYGKTRFCRTIF